MAKVFAFMNLKGGVGKSVIGANLAREFSTQVKKKVLLVDLDPQCSISSMLVDDENFADRPRRNTTYETLDSVRNNPKDLLDHDIEVVYVDRRTLLNPGSGAEVHLLPGSTEIYNLIAKGGIINSKLALLILDTNPSMNMATLCALEVADFIIAPITMDIFAVRGIFILIDIFGNEFPGLLNWERTAGIWNAVDFRYRRVSQLSTAEQQLRKRNENLVRFALTRAC